MKKLTLLLALTLLLCACGTGVFTSRNDPNQALLSELTGVADRFFAAVYSSDRAAQNEVMANEFVMTLVDGRTIDRSRMLMLPSRPGFTTTVTNPQLASSTPDSAVVSYTEVSGPSGSRPSPGGRLTVSYARRDGRWQLTSIRH